MMVNKDWTSELRHAHHRSHEMLMHRHVTVLRVRVHLLVRHVRSHWSSHISHVRPSVHLKVVVLALMPHRSLFVKVDCGEFDALALWGNWSICLRWDRAKVRAFLESALCWLTHFRSLLRACSKTFWVNSAHACEAAIFLHLVVKSLA